MTDVPPPPPPPSFGAPPPGGAAPDVGTALSYGWKKFQAHVGVALAVVLIPIAVQIVFGILGQGALRSSIPVWALLQIVSMVASAIAAIGVYRVALMITAGETPTVGKAFEYDRWGEWILFSIVFGIMVGVGLVLCVIPGLFVLAFFGLAPYYFIDGRLGLGEALSASYAATSSKKLAVPVLLCVVVGALGAIACGIGYLITAPMAYFAVGFLYRYAAGQPVAA